MKKTFFSILCLGFSFFSYSQDNYFKYNGVADVLLRYQPNGSGGRALVHDSNNSLTINYNNDFAGGVRVMSDLNIFQNLFIGNSVGIGTYTPTHRLEVNGNIKSSNIIIPLDGRLSINLADNFTYQNKSIGHYSFAWVYDSWKSGAATLWQSAYSGIKFFTAGQYRMGINSEGNVGIGTDNPQNKLDVNGTIRATEVKVEAGWADFVFDKDYKLPTLQEVENHINEHNHLPDIPSEAEVKENGVSLGEMQAKLLQKIEELTLYVIKQDKTIKEQGEKMNKQAELIKELQSKLE